MITIAHHFLLNRYSPFTALVDSKFEVLYLFGQSATYFEMSTGKPTYTITKLVNDELRPQLRKVLRVALDNNEESEANFLARRGGEFYSIKITATPLKTNNTKKRLLVVSFAKGTRTFNG